QGLADNSVALGAGSAATDANTVSIGSDSLKRRIVNMEAGVDANDGVIVQQLNEGLAEANRYTDEAIRNIPAGLIPTSITKNFDRLESRANAAGALAMAMGAASNASVYTCTNFSWRECRGTVSVGVGHLDDEMAAAISYSRPLTRRSFFNINVGVADDEVGSSIGMGFNL
nr:YadA-like family protein [Gammaproteobacteria bacterium]